VNGSETAICSRWAECGSGELGVVCLWDGYRHQYTHTRCRTRHTHTRLPVGALARPITRYCGLAEATFGAHQGLWKKLSSVCVCACGVDIDVNTHTHAAANAIRTLAYLLWHSHDPNARLRISWGFLWSTPRSVEEVEFGVVWWARMDSVGWVNPSTGKVVPGRIGQSIAQISRYG
jgi:hypothetical protein